MAQPVFPTCQYSEYLSQLERSQIRLEYLDGVVYAMAGGTPRHNKLCARVAAQLGSRLQEGCEAYSPDQRVRAQGAGFFPDFTVVCGGEQLAADDRNAITNPTLVVEVLSPSTAATDQTTKADRYKATPSLQSYVLIWQEERRVQVHRRAGSDWVVTDHRGDGEVELGCCQGVLQLSELYRGLD